MHTASKRQPYYLTINSKKMTTPTQTIEFYLPSGSSYAVEVLSFEHLNEELTTTIEVNPEMWETIDMVMLFNLTWQNRNEGSVSGEKAVQIEMVFGKEVYAELKKSGDLIVDFISFLAAHKDHPMKSTTNWFITQVTEEVDLPEELKELGAVREGFTTTWKK